VKLRASEKVCFCYRTTVSLQNVHWVPGNELSRLAACSRCLGTYHDYALVSKLLAQSSNPTGRLIGPLYWVYSGFRRQLSCWYICWYFTRYLGTYNCATVCFLRPHCSTVCTESDCRTVCSIRRSFVPFNNGSLQFLPMYR
jgi:hypothetical protein